MTNHIKKEISKLIQEMNDFPVFKYWDFNKKEFIDTPLNKLSYKFIESLSSTLFNNNVSLFTDEDLERFVILAVIQSAFIAYFGNASYEAEGEKSHCGGVDSIQEQFTVWVMSDDNQESYLKNLKDYRDKKIYLGISPSQVDTYLKENRLDGIRKWTKTSELFELFKQFRDLTHPLTKDQKLLDVTILTELVNIVRSGNYSETAVMKQLLGTFAHLSHSYIKRKMVVDIYKKYYDILEESVELNILRYLEEYLKLEQKLNDIFMNDNGRLTLAHNEINTFQHIIDSVIYLTKSRKNSDIALGSNIKSDVYRLLLQSIRKKIESMPQDLINDTYEPWSTDNEIDNKYGIEILMKEIKRENSKWNITLV